MVKVPLMVMIPEHPDRGLPEELLGVPVIVQSEYAFRLVMRMTMSKRADFLTFNIRTTMKKLFGSLM